MRVVTRCATREKIQDPLTNLSRYHLFVDVPHLGFSQDLGLELPLSRRHHADAGVAVDVHEAQGTEAVKPGVGNTLFHMLATGDADQFFQGSHYLGSLTACSTLWCQYHIQLTAHLIKQDATRVLGKFLEFAGIHQSPLSHSTERP
ncbi:hypothetical protein D3C85_1492870 [compost metagenome]